MQMIIVYSDGIHPTAFDSLAEALDHIIEDGHDAEAEALIEYIGGDQASVTSGQHLDSEITGRINDLAESKAKQSQLESEIPQ
tara:strand:+ start:592 stop:840 length:249 start_codon:yes stop_codon:yes gene_type:complete